MQLSLRELTRLFGVTEQTVFHWVNDQGLPAQQINGQLWFNRAELLEWATLQKIELPARFLQATSNNGHKPLLSAALERGGVRSKVMGASRLDILHSVVEGMALPEGMDRELLLHVLVSRDTTGLTYLGDGLAVPHARFPIVLPLARPLLTIAYLEQAVNFAATTRSGRQGFPSSAPGQAAVHTLFVLVCPTTHEHLALLARLAYALRDKEFNGLVKSKAPIEALLKRALSIEEELVPVAIPGGLDSSTPSGDYHIEQQGRREKRV
jgi:nitrogen PTS system EIIA component